MRRILIVFGLLFSVTASAATTEIRHVFGWVENATLEPMGARVKAKLDTGALTSSLHALNVERFEKDGEEWVRFKVKVEDQKDDEMVSETFERPVYRDLTVRGAGGRGRTLTYGRSHPIIPVQIVHYAMRSGHHCAQEGARPTRGLGSHPRSFMVPARERVRAPRPASRARPSSTLLVPPVP